MATDYRIYHLKEDLVPKNIHWTVSHYRLAERLRAEGKTWKQAVVSIGFDEKYADRLAWWFKSQKKKRRDAETT